MIDSFSDPRRRVREVWSRVEVLLDIGLELPLPPQAPFNVAQHERDGIVQSTLRSPADPGR